MRSVQLADIATNIGLLGYALAAAAYLAAFQQQGEQRPKADSLGRVAFFLFVIATCGVSVALAAMARDASLGEISGLLLTSAIGWLAIGAHLQFNMKLLGALVAPLSTLILLVKFFMSPGKGEMVALGEGGLLVKAHVAMAVLGQAFAILACGISLLYLWQQNLLKKKLLTQIPQSLPAIDRLGKALTFCLWGGFTLLTSGLLTGAWFTQLYTPSPELRLGWKIAWAVLVWIWYLATLLAKNVFNRPSKRIAQMSLAGFLLLAVTYFGMGVFKNSAGGL